MVRRADSSKLQRALPPCGVVFLPRSGRGPLSGADGDNEMILGRQNEGVAAGVGTLGFDHYTCPCGPHAKPYRISMEHHWGNLVLYPPC
jgi:hypothetical protein